MQFGRTTHWLGVVIAIGSLAAAVAAQTGSATSPYAGFEDRPIKALSAEQVEGYESGSGMGFALAAELNGYPGPKHVLELEEALELSPEQLDEVERVFAEMKSSAETLGGQIIARESELDRQFASHAIDTEGLELQTREIALLEGQLRAVHLAAHLEMMEILRPQQIHRYIELRGYHGGDHSRHHPSGGHSPAQP